MSAMNPMDKTRTVPRTGILSHPWKGTVSQGTVPPDVADCTTLWITAVSDRYSACFYRSAQTSRAETDANNVIELTTTQPKDFRTKDFQLPYYSPIHFGWLYGQRFVHNSLHFKDMTRCKLRYLDRFGFWSKIGLSSYSKSSNYNA